MDCELTRSAITVPYKEKYIDAIVTAPAGITRYKCGVILTHGAGGDMNTEQLIQVCDHLASSGFLAVRFTCRGLNIKYRIAVFTQVLKSLKTMYSMPYFFVGGRSMGARAAVGMVTGSLSQDWMDVIAGVVCLSYPLHTTDKVLDLRDKPLYDLTKPVLFISGSHDPMCQKDVMMTVVGKLEKCKFDIYWIDGADHSLKVKKDNQSGMNVCNLVTSWCSSVVKQLTPDIDFKKTRVEIDVRDEQLEIEKKSKSNRKRHQNNDEIDLVAPKRKSKSNRKRHQNNDEIDLVAPKRKSKSNRKRHQNNDEIDLVAPKRKSKSNRKRHQNNDEIDLVAPKRKSKSNRKRHQNNDEIDLVAPKRKSKSNRKRHQNNDEIDLVAPKRKSKSTNRKPRNTSTKK